MVVKPCGVFDELHYGATWAVHTNRRFKGGIHGDAAKAADFSKGKNVGKGLWVIPHAAKILEVANEVRRLSAAVGVNLEGGPAGTNVCEESRIVENGHGGLTVKEDPRLGDKIVSLCKSKLSKGKTGDDNILGLLSRFDGVSTTLEPCCRSWTAGAGAAAFDTFDAAVGH